MVENEDNTQELILELENALLKREVRMLKRQRADAIVVGARVLRDMTEFMRGLLDEPMEPGAEGLEEGERS